MAKANQPVAKYRLGYVTATIWLNDEHYNTVLTRSYKEGDDWHETDQLNHGDLMNASKVLEQACDFISAR